MLEATIKTQMKLITPASLLCIFLNDNIKAILLKKIKKEL